MPPTVVDLPGAAACGQTPQPMSTCGSGSRPGQGSCVTGWIPFSDPGICSPTGSNPSISGCSGGLIATPVRCTTGSVPAVS